MSDPYGLDGLEGLWARTLGDPSVRVAVLDGPVDRSHPSLASSDLECRETLVPCRAGRGAATRHGTQVASLLFGRHGGPVPGVAPGCRGLVLPLFAEGANARDLSCSEFDLTRAVNRAAEGGASVVNVSGGRPSSTGAAHPLLEDAVRRCESRGILVVAAAGNDGCDCLHLPAALPNVLTVGALDRSGRPLDFSNWGASYRLHGIMAPGENLPAARLGGGSEPCTGTSYATAIVSGVVALLVSLQVQMGRRADPLAIADLLISTARGCDPLDTPDSCRRLLAGRLDLEAALGVLSGSSPVFLPSPGGRGEEDWEPSAAVSDGRSTLLPSASLPLGRPVYPIGRLSAERTDAPTGESPPVRVGPSELEDHPWPSGSIAWTLEVDGLPAYALRVDGPFGREVDHRLRQLYREQEADGAGRVAVPGRISGEVTLSTGPIVAEIGPELRGLGRWAASGFEGSRAEAAEFLERAASGRRNLGITPEDRALNYCWPLAGPTFEAAVGAGMELDSVDVEAGPSPPGRDCWEVALTFYRPVEGDPACRRVVRFTVDVADVLPVLADGPKSWSIR